MGTIEWKLALDLLDARAEHRECQEALARETGRRLTAERRIKELKAVNEVLTYNLTDDVRRIREYKNEWELCCERERARWETEKELNGRVKELEGALREIVALKWGAFGCSEPAHIAERLLNGGGEDE
jgi:hypothetical protein